MSPINFHRWKTFCVPHGLIYTLLILIIICLSILTIVFASLWRSHRKSSPDPIYAVEKGIVGFPPRLPDGSRYVQWTFLHLNDVYEILPLDDGRKGGLARVAHMRRLLKEENPHTYTILGGDFLSPSALSTSKVNGTSLNGRQMIATFNAMGLDYATFGNHEFDLNENDLRARMNESTFSYISTNVFRVDRNESFGSSVSHRILTIDRVRILLIGLTIDSNNKYVRIVNSTSLVAHVQQFLRQFPNDTYDILVAITHLDIATDVILAEKLPQIDLILGGHEHEDYYYLRGSEYTPIYKADANAFTVYILRCAYNIDRKQFLIYPTLAQVTSDVPEDEKTAKVANYWFDLGIAGFRALGFEPREIVSCLPKDIELDGRSESVRFSSTELTDIICQSMIKATETSGSTIGLFNSGAIRIDDVLRLTVTQYDILRTLPFPNNLSVLSIPGQLLAEILGKNRMEKGGGSLLLYAGIKTLDDGKTWLVNDTDISTTDRRYTVATIEYTRTRTDLNHKNVTIVQKTNISQTKGLVDYLKVIYPPCRKHQKTF